MKLSFLFILVPLFLMLSGASETINQKRSPTSQKVRSDEYKAAAKNVQDDTNSQPEKTSPFQIELLETLRTIAKQNKAAYEQGRADEKSWDSPSVLVNIGVFFVGACYTFFAWRQWQAIGRQANIANKTLALVARPKLIVRQATVRGQQSTERDFEIDYAVTNIGGTTAHVLKSNATIFPSKNPLPGVPPYDENTNVIGTPVIESGQSVPCSRGFSAIPPDAAITIFLIGYVDYRDEVGIVRRTAFCRQLNKSSGRFSPAADPDYEYAD